MHERPSDSLPTGSFEADGVTDGEATAATPGSIASLPASLLMWPRRYAVRIEEWRGYDYRYTVTTRASEKTARRLAVANHGRGPGAIKAVTSEVLGPAPRSADDAPLLTEGDLTDSEEFAEDYWAG